ncbi:unnamed protein product [Cunninghamella echinulata]
MVKQHTIEHNYSTKLSIIGESSTSSKCITKTNSASSSLNSIPNNQHHHNHHHHHNYIIPTSSSSSSISSSSIILNDQIDSLLPNLSDIELNSNINSRFDFNMNPSNSIIMNDDNEYIDDDYLTKWTPLFPLPPSEPTTLVSTTDINAHLVPSSSTSLDQVSTLPTTLTSFPNVFQHNDNKVKSTTTSVTTTNILKHSNIIMKKKNKKKDHNQKHQQQKPVKMTLDALQFLKVLGKGCMGKVILVRHHQTSRLYALKAISKEGLNARKEIEHVLMERNILSKVSQVHHPFLIKLHHSFQNTNQLFLLMDYHPGSDLATQLCIHPQFTPYRTQFYMAEIILGLQELHRLGILYRDLKPENILLAADGHIVLTDFGFSKLFDRQQEEDRIDEYVADDELLPYHTLTFCGTPEYIAPELLIQEGYTYAVDFWSLGVVFYEMLLGITPYYDENDDELYEKILNDPVDIPDHLDSFTKDLILGLLEHDPRLRIGCAHFFEPDLDGINEIRDHPYFSNINWNDVYHKRLPAPFIPRIQSETDVSHFDPAFVNLSPRLSALSQFNKQIDDDLDDDLYELDNNNNNTTHDNQLSAFNLSDQQKKYHGEANDDDDDDYYLNVPLDQAFIGYSFINENTCIDTDSLLDDDDEEVKEQVQVQVNDPQQQQPKNILEANERSSHYYGITNMDALSSLKQLQQQLQSTYPTPLPPPPSTTFSSSLNAHVSQDDNDDNDDNESDISPSQRLGFSRFQQRHNQNQSRLSSSFTLESLHNEDDIIWLH